VNSLPSWPGGRITSRGSSQAVSTQPFRAPRRGVLLLRAKAGCLFKAQGPRRLANGPGPALSHVLLAWLLTLPAVLALPGAHLGSRLRREMGR
jgi:hypothetical protein